MQHLRLLFAVSAIVSLSACLENDIQRGAAGAVGGALVADALGGNPVTGAIVGGAAGALCDEVTQICR